MSTWSGSESTSSKAERAEAILCNTIVDHNISFLLMHHLPKVKDCRLYEPSKEVVTATRKVTQGSELAPKGPPAKPLLTSKSHQQPGSNSHGTKQKKKGKK